MPERKKRGREKELPIVDSRPLPPVSSGGKLSSRAARQRALTQREEQLAAQKVCVLHMQYMQFTNLQSHVSLLPSFQYEYNSAQKQ